MIKKIIIILLFFVCAGCLDKREEPKWVDVGNVVSIRYMAGNLGAVAATEVTTTKGVFVVRGSISVCFDEPVAIDNEGSWLRFTNFNHGCRYRRVIF